MLYRVCHITEYLYAQPVSQCYNLAHIIPRTSHRQKCMSTDISVTPNVASKSIRDDYFGNRAYHFEIQRAHEKLILKATSKVETRAQLFNAKLDAGTTCEDAVRQVKYGSESDCIFAREFLLDSPMIKVNEALRAYAAPLFTPKKPLLQAALELTQKIFKEFTYCSEATTIATPLDEVLKNKKVFAKTLPTYKLLACAHSVFPPNTYLATSKPYHPQAKKSSSAATPAMHGCQYFAQGKAG